MLAWSRGAKIGKTVVNSTGSAILAAILFVALAFVALRSGNEIYRSGAALEVEEEGDAVVLRWVHPIEAPMARRIADAYEQHRAAARFVIDIHSPGGAIAEGRLVIAEIERMRKTHPVETRVSEGRMCASMCVPVYLAGDTRTAAANARFMFHEPARYDYFTEERAAAPAIERRFESDRFFERYFETSGMSEEFRAALRANWRGKDLWFTAEELLVADANVVQTLR